MQTQASIEINKPIEQIFDYTINNVEWSTIVVKEEVVDEKPEGVGTTFKIVTEDRGCQMEFDGTVTHHKPPTEHTVVMIGKQFDITAEYRFENLGDKTRVTQRSIVQGKGFVKIMFALFGWLMNKSSCQSLEKELLNLKQLAEAQES